MSIFETYEGNTDWFMVICFSLLFLIFVIGLPLAIYEGYWIEPIASDNANDYCKSLGFDQYKEFSRIGILSENPVGIKCEYAERYTDLGVRSNIQE